MMFPATPSIRRLVGTSITLFCISLTLCGLLLLRDFPGLLQPGNPLAPAMAGAATAAIATPAINWGGTGPTARSLR